MFATGEIPVAVEIHILFPGEERMGCGRGLEGEGHVVTGKPKCGVRGCSIAAGGAIVEGIYKPAAFVRLMRKRSRRR